MNRRYHPSFFGSSVAAACAALAITALSAGPGSAAADLHPRLQFSGAIGNPVTGNQGFTAFVHHDVAVTSTENEGTMALGGDLTIGPTSGNYNVAAHAPSHPFVAPGDSQPTGLLIGGGVDWAGSNSSGIVQVQSGTYVKLGDPTGTDVLGTGGSTQLVPTAGARNSTPRVELTTTQPADSVVQSGLVDFDAVFAAYKQRSTDMANCPDTVVPTEANNTTPLPQPWPAGTQAYLTLDTTHTNVWTVTKEQLAALSNITLRNLPTANGPLVINVLDDTGDFSWQVQPLAGFGGAAAPYVLWNFPQTTNLTMTGTQSVDGTVFAPNAQLVDIDSGNIQGNVIVDSLIHGDSTHIGGEIHDFPFVGNVDCEPVTPTETETGSPTVTPTETETCTVSPTPPTESPTETETETPSESPTETETAAESPTETETPTESPTETETETPTESPAETETPTSPPPTTETATPTGTRSPCRPLPPTGASVGPSALYPALGMVAGGAVILGAVQYRRRARRH